MSQENVEIVRRAYESVNTRSEPVRELFDPDFELDTCDVAEATVVRGLEAAMAVYRPY
jgi:hypothetical protein